MRSLAALLLMTLALAACHRGAEQQKPTPNLTGTMEAFRPDGALGSGRIRPASTGDYEPWIPE